MSVCYIRELLLGLLVLYHNEDLDGWMDDGKHL